ncbi:MAG: hemolysin family protein [Acidimicrobiales bacterium]
MIVASFSGADGAILVAVAVLIVVSAVLALAETSLTRVSRTRAKALEESEARGSKSLSRLVEHPERFLAPILLLVLICQLVAATLVGVVAAHVLGALGVAAATVFEVVVIFLFAEAVPKQWAVHHGDKAALFAAPIVAAFVAFPPVRAVASLLIGIAQAITPKGRSQPAAEAEILESELLAFTDVAVEEEAIETEERELIHSIIDFGDTIVREVMVPRPDVVAVSGQSEAGAVLERAISAGLSRIPVFEGSVDNVVGIAFTKDLVRAVRQGNEHRDVVTLARPAHYVPETKRVAPLMREMQSGQFHLAVVIDEYGGTSGVVTLEDLIEELVGEIFDEFDVDEPLVEPLGPGQWRVSARMVVDEVNELLGTDLPLSDDWDTIGGLVLAKLGRIPNQGEAVELGGHLLVAERMQGRRIGTVRLVKPAEAQLRLVGGETGEVVGGGVGGLGVGGMGVGGMAGRGGSAGEPGGAGSGAPSQPAAGPGNRPLGRSAATDDGR